MPIPQVALLSAYHKDALLRDFAQELVRLGWRLLASSGTKRFLDQHGVPSEDVGDLVGPPILGHRVVTLDRKIYAALLARIDRQDDMAELARIGVSPISLVYVGLYPLAEALARPDCSVSSVTEMIDIGGPALLRAAAKGGCYVLSHPDQFAQVVRFIESPPSQQHPVGIIVGRTFMAGLAAAAERVASEYAALAADFYQSVAERDFPHRWR